jgi:hypothetical protein
MMNDYNYKNLNIKSIIITSMKHNLRTICMTMLLAGFALSSWGQDRNNQDGVAKVNVNTSAYDFVPGQVLVKFKASSPVTVNQAKGQFQAVSASTVNTLLTDLVSRRWKNCSLTKLQAEH